MNFDYDYGLIDANYILFRNKSVQLRYTNEINPKKLLLSVLQSFMKLKRDVNFQYAILFWDRSPYIKTEVLNNYKGDRYRPTTDDIIDLKNQLLNPDLTEEQKDELKKQITQEELDIKNFQLTSSVKYLIINEFNDMGFKSLAIKGYEADDLAYLTAKYLESINKTGILLTADTDWINFTNSKVKFISTKNWSDYTDLTEYRTTIQSKVPNLSNYYYGILSEIFWGGHNNTPEYPENIPFEEFCTKILNKDESLKLYKDYRAYFDAMNMEPYYEDIKDYIIKICSDNKIIHRKMYDYCIDTGFNLNLSTYNNYTTGYKITEGV